jgi:hypothetical protein
MSLADQLFQRLDWRRVRLHDGRAPGRSTDVVRRVVLWASGGRAVTLGNHVFLPAWCRDDPAVLAHELTHCAQYQAWGVWRYFTRGAVAQARELLHRTVGIGASPYAYTMEPDKPFHAYGMEQQAQIIEDEVRRSPRSPPIAPRYFRPDPQSWP